MTPRDVRRDDSLCHCLLANRRRKRSRSSGLGPARPPFGCSFRSMDSRGPVGFVLLLFLFQAAGEMNPPQNLTCNPGSSLLLCLDLPEGDSSSAHVLLWSASKRKGLVIWTPERNQYIIKPSHSGRITYLGYSSFQLNNLRQSDEGLYEVLVRTPGSPNPLLLHERMSYSFDINITTDLLVNNSCTLGLHCVAPPPSFGIPGDFLVGYTTAKVLLTPPPLFFLYLYLFKRKASRQTSYPVESFSMAPTVSPPRDPTSPMDPDF